MSWWVRELLVLLTFGLMLLVAVALAESLDMEPGVAALGIACMAASQNIVDGAS